MARTERRMEVTDGAVLAAMAHPLRVALLYQLNALGSRTASQCAQAAGAVVKIARVRPDLDAMAAAVGLSWPVPGSAGDPPD